MLRGLETIVVGVALAIALGGCVSKTKARQQAREAFMAGQQQAMERLLRERSGPTVTVIGPVTMPVVTWKEDLTVANAIVAAGYQGKGDPKQIVIIRNGFGIPVDPKGLLSGHDVPLEKGDVLQIMP